MTKILVPTDFSPTAETAFRFAVKLAGKTGSEVVLYHVFTPLENPYIDTLEKRDAYNLKMTSDLKQQLEQLKNSISADNRDVSITTALGRSPIIDTILNYAEENGFGMIIMGTQGASGIKKVVIGSQAARIIEDAEMPVLLVPENFTGNIPQKVLFATTCNVRDKEPISTVLNWIAPMHPKFSIVHICEDETVDSHATIKNYESSIPASFNKADVSFKRIGSSYAIETMEQLGTKFPYDMLAMIRRKKNFFGRIFLKSLSRDMAYLTKYPLLVIPEK